MEIVTSCIAGLREEKRFFHQFSDEELDLLGELFHLTRCQPEEILIEEGSPVGGPFSIVVTGVLEIKKNTDFGRPIVLARVGRGALLGYASIYQRVRPFPITAMALEKTEILFMPRDEFTQLIQDYPAIGVKILREIVRVQDIRLQELLERFTATL